MTQYYNPQLTQEYKSCPPEVTPISFRKWKEWTDADFEAEKARLKDLISNMPPVARILRDFVDVIGFEKFNTLQKSINLQIKHEELRGQLIGLSKAIEILKEMIPKDGD